VSFFLTLLSSYTQMSLSKKLAAEELKKLCDSHSASFSDELPSFFTDNVLAPDRTRLTESAKLDYASSVDAAVTILPSLRWS
jgi:hypothetical protein